MKNSPEIKLTEPPSLLEGRVLGRLVATEDGGEKIETFDESVGEWVEGGAGIVDFMPGKASWAEPSDFEAVGLEFPDPSTIVSSAGRRSSAEESKD